MLPKLSYIAFGFQNLQENSGERIQPAVQNHKK